MVWDYIQQGGIIMYILLALNIIGFTIMFSKAYILFKHGVEIPDVANKISGTIKGQNQKDTEFVMELAKREVSQHMDTLETGLNTVKIIASIAPLLGLLGTVIGVFISFKIMAETGMGSPEKFANGISMALLTTVAGMVVAIPHYVGHNYLLSMVDKLESRIEKVVISKLGEAA
ncbi:MAG: MotA/TolQ/ExbB proton channel family protein [Bacteriovoracaceae bacterium]